MIEKIIYIVLLPSVLANVLHMFLVKKGVLSLLAWPIQERMFGQNKTYRGFIFITLLTATFSGVGSFFVESITAQQGMFTGALIGLAYSFFELPNSFLKRRLGIKSGGTSIRNKWAFIVLDKTDSTFGVSLVYFLVSDLSILQGLYLFFVSVALHVGFSFLLVAVKIKKSF